MSETLASSAFFGVLISLGLYWLGAALKKRLRLAIANPLLIAIGGTIVCLLLTGVDYADYSAAARPLSFLLTPATVCLAVPLYRQLPLMRRYWKAVLGGIAIGVVVSLFSVFLLALAFSLSNSQYATLLPKSITTAIGYSAHWHCGQRAGRAGMQAAAHHRAGGPGRGHRHLRPRHRHRAGPGNGTGDGRYERAGYRGGGAYNRGAGSGFFRIYLKKRQQFI